MLVRYGVIIHCGSIQSERTISLLCLTWGLAWETGCLASLESKLEIHQWY